MAEGQESSGLSHMGNYMLSSKLPHVLSNHSSLAGTGHVVTPTKVSRRSPPTKGSRRYHTTGTENVGTCMFTKQHQWWPQTFHVKCLAQHPLHIHPFPLSSLLPICALVYKMERSISQKHYPWIPKLCSVQYLNQKMLHEKKLCDKINLRNTTYYIPFRNSQCTVAL